MTDNFKDSDFSSGYYLNRYLTENKINPADFAKTLDVDLDKINAVLNADMPLEKGMPEKLARAIGTSSALWRNLDKQYWEKKKMTDLKTELKRSQKLASKAIFNKNLDSYDNFKKFLRLYLVQEALKPSSVAMIDRNSRFYQEWNDKTRAKCGSIKSIPDLIPFFKRFAKETKLDLNIDDTFVDPLDTQIYFSWLNDDYDQAHPYDD